jgi:murein DD-endopeptidase MepM/ murein hydrolase activator NlpD
MPGRRPAGASRTLDLTRLRHMNAGPSGAEPNGGAGGPGVAATARATRAAARSAARSAARAAARKGTKLLAGVIGTPAARWAVGAGARLLGRVGPRRLLAAAVAGSALMCCLPGLFVAGLFGALGGSQPAVLAACFAPGEADAVLAALDGEQRANGALIVEVGVSLAVPPRGWVIAVATAVQESSLRNLPHLGPDNDHDSLGLFQQRPSQGWGTPEELTDPRQATTRFYQRLLLVEGWQAMSLTAAAQAVQRSAHPDAYAAHEPLAVALVDTVVGGVAAAAAFDPNLRCALAGEVTAAGWTHPVPVAAGDGFRNVACGGPGQPRCHYGADLSAPHGTVIVAAADGVVTLVRCNASLAGEPYSCDVDAPLDANGVPLLQGCGWYVNIRHAGDVVTRYCHMLAQPEVEVGQQVVAGQRIGLVGSSGRSSGPHLHFEVHLGADPTDLNAIDPVPFLAARGVVL